MVNWAVLTMALLQVSDKPSRAVSVVGCADLLVVVYGCVRIKQCVADPAMVGERASDIFARLPGSVEVSPGFVVLYRLLVVAECLAYFPSICVDDAEAFFGLGSLFVIIGWSHVQSLMIAV